MPQLLVQPQGLVVEERLQQGLLEVPILMCQFHDREWAYMKCIYFFVARLARSLEKND